MVTRFVEEMLSGRKVEEEREGRKRRGNAYILERGGGNDPPPIACIRERSRARGRGREKREVVREDEREDSLFVGGDIYYSPATVESHGSGYAVASRERVYRSGGGR